MNHKATKKIISDCSECAQQLINELHERDPQNDTFTQLGLLDGLKIISDYLKHNELGLALEHLLYMIHESDIQFDQEQVALLHSIAKQLKIPNHYTVETFNASSITVYNIPFV